MMFFQVVLLAGVFVCPSGQTHFLAARGLASAFVHADCRQRVGVDHASDTARVSQADRGRKPYDCHRKTARDYRRVAISRVVVDRPPGSGVAQRFSRRPNISPVRGFQFWFDVGTVDLPVFL